MDKPAITHSRSIFRIWKGYLGIGYFLWGARVRLLTRGASFIEKARNSGPFY
jgi:hypothetical protein